MALITPTDDQRSALEADGPLVAVAAGAGSGKTTLLVERIWRDVTVDGLPVERLFVACFNRAAAAHLAERLQRRFADPEHGWPDGRARLDLSAGWIGTFHSLCARIAREHPLAAGVDPLFGEIDEGEAAALQDEAFARALALVDHPGALDLLASGSSTDRVRTSVRETYAQLRAAGHAVPRIPAPPPPDPSLEGARVDLAARIVDLAARADINKHHRNGIEKLAPLLAGRALGDKAPALNRNAQATVKEEITAVNDLIERVWQALIEERARPQLAGFTALFDAFAAEYATLKRTRGLLDFDDLQFAALRVLEGGHPYRFARVYVDEFQDVNGLQNRIVDALGAPRVMVVGDGAQAIYGFRHADPEHLLARSCAGAAVELRDNHRSQKPLMGALNALFGRVMADQPVFRELRSRARPDPHAPDLSPTPVELIALRSSDGARVTRAQEAAVVADEVCLLLKRGYRPRDIAVLFRALTQVDAYRDALLERDVPLHLGVAGGLLEHEQVADVLALLAVVDNPHDEPALVRVLASPFVGASDADLVALRRAAGAGRPLWPVVAAVPTTAGLVELRNGLVPLLRERGLAALVEAAVEAGGYELAVLAHTDGAQRYANLRRLVRLAQRVEELHGPSMAALRTSVEALMARGGRDPGEAVLVDPELDAVRLASIHAVKGQQFPVVILADTNHRLRADTPDVRVADDGRVGFRLLRARAKAVAAFAHRELSGDAAERAEREERRLLYVALTRAMRHVVIVGPAAPDSGTQQAVLLAAAEEIAEAVPAVRVEKRETPPVEAPEYRTSPAAPPLRPAPLPPVVPTEPVDPLDGRELSFTALATAQTCLRRFRLEVEEGLPASTRSLTGAGFGDGPQSREGTRVGVLVHRLLAAHRWGGPPPPAGWAATMASDAGPPLTPAAHERAERLVLNALRGPLAHRLAAGDPRSEVSFALTCAGVTFTGAFDLVVREPDGGFLLVDWKTNRLGDDGPERAMEPYRLQQVLYGLAALRTGAPSVELHWVFLERPDAPVVWRVGRGDSPLLEDELRAALAPLRRSERPPITERVGPWCRGCPGLDAFCPAGDHLRVHGEQSSGGPLERRAKSAYS